MKFPKEVIKYFVEFINFLKFIWNNMNNFERFLVVFCLLFVLSVLSGYVEYKRTYHINTGYNKLDDPYQVIDKGETKEYIFKKEIEGSVQTITVSGEGVSVVVNK